MLNLYLAALTTLASTSSAIAFDHSHKAWQTQLESHVDQDGWVDYKSWKTQSSALDSYLKDLSAVSHSQYSKFSKAEKQAFLVNAYNAFTIRLILDFYPVKSIKKATKGWFGSPWKSEFFKLLDGKITHLDQIEHEYLRKKSELKDARVHAAVNCASVSCPKLQRYAFTAAKIDEQFASATREWLADTSRNKFNEKKGKAEISRIFSWFDEDFGGNDKGIAKFISEYGPDSAKKLFAGDYDIDYLDYNWDLNEKK